jgi:hypothetical protein
MQDAKLSGTAWGYYSAAADDKIKENPCKNKGQVVKPTL